MHKTASWRIFNLTECEIVGPVGTAFVLVILCVPLAAPHVPGWLALVLLQPTDVLHVVRADGPAILLLIILILRVLLCREATPSIYLVQLMRFFLNGTIFASIQAVFFKKNKKNKGR